MEAWAAVLTGFSEGELGDFNHIFTRREPIAGSVAGCDFTLGLIASSNTAARRRTLTEGVSLDLRFAEPIESLRNKEFRAAKAYAACLCGDFVIQRPESTAKLFAATAYGIEIPYYAATLL